MATADLGVMLMWGRLSFSPLIDLLRAFRKRMVSASRSVVLVDRSMAGHEMMRKVHNMRRGSGVGRMAASEWRANKQ